ncbi:MAG TPA: hypothetical protein VH722_15720 [Alphaproteobacteria bacterium]|jgi:hypothetical protein|nr:hypothetical protein [Alphaproteobacteria bacterium]
MNSPWISLLALVAFLLATALGLFARHRLADRYMSEETTAVLHSTVGMLVTFAAIVVGLLMSSAKTDFQNAEAVMRNYAASLVSLNDSLREAGPGGAEIQHALAAYTAATIAATWTRQAPPPGDYYPKGIAAVPGGQLTDNPRVSGLLGAVADQVAALPGETAGQRQVRARCLALVEQVTQAHWSLITASQGSFSTPFFIVLVFWMSVAFLCLGLSAPANRLSLTVIALAALAMGSALFVIVDLDTLYDDGLFAISSGPMESALARMPH